MEQQAHRQQWLGNKTLQWEGALSVVLMISTLLTGCGESTPPIDICNDRAGDECGHLLKSKCGLSGNMTVSELLQCEPYVRCENESFDECMEEQQR